MTVMEPKELRKYDTFIHYAMAAADMAVASSGLAITSENATAWAS